MIAVVGASGQLGSALVRVLGPSCAALTRSDFDITDTGTMRAVLTDLKPDAIINAAAYTAVDRAETERDAAFAANARAVGEMSELAADIGAGFVTFSTDYVFDGTSVDGYGEAAEPNPLNVYGATKLEGERRALDAHPGSLVIRTSWVLSGTHPNFAATIVERMRVGPVQVVDDQFGRPTVADDLAVASLTALRAGAAGLLHLTNSPTVSWYQLAQACAALADLDVESIEPVPTVDVPGRARRPRMSALVSERLAEWGLDPLPDWRQSLPAVVAAIDSPR